MARFRLVALDIDGTILTSDHTLRPRVTAAIRAVQAQGVRVCLATGKLFVSLAMLHQAFDLHGPQITCNGAAIVDADSGTLDAAWPMTPSEIAASLDALARAAPDLPIAWYTTEAIFTTAPPGPLDDLLVAYHEPTPLHVGDFAALPPPTKLLVTAAPARLEALRTQIEPLLAGRVHVVRTSVDFLECMRPGVNKGAALEVIMQRAGIARAATLAIGDSENDLPLLQAAGFSIAMQNATPAVLAQANATTPSNDEDGVAHAMERWVLAPPPGPLPIRGGEGEL
jgi:Cof subfamily protein (haloacid dehalogenase superfamily)